MHARAPVFVLLLALGACGVRRPTHALDAAPGDAPAHPSSGPGAHSSTLALDEAQGLLFVAQPDSDALAVADVRARTLVNQLALAPAPAPDAQGRYTPAVSPVSVALAAGSLWVAGERSGRVYRVRASRSPVLEASAEVCARPVGLVASRDGRSVWVSCAADELVLRLDGNTLVERGRARTRALPWALGLSADERTLAVAHLHDGALALLDAQSLASSGARAVNDVAPRGNRLLAHGRVRSVYDVLERPGHAGEWWLAHELHGDDTAQPELDFESTVFAALSVSRPGATFAQTYSIDSRLANHPGQRDGELSDVLSGPRALAFTPDGRFALVLAQASEDVLLFDCERGMQAGLVRPVPGDWLTGLAVAADGRSAWIDARNSGQLVSLALRQGEGGGLEAEVAGEPINARPSDPMPAVLRLGQRVFHTANDSEVPLTTNRWMACASCHPEGTTDRVTWLFSQGPRDTPSNAGGTDGFLFRTADRRDVTEYWKTIRLEQGGHFLPDDEVLAPYLHAVAAYVQQAIPVPPPPRVDASRVALGLQVFSRPDVGCPSCHAGPRGTDSGQGNPALDLAGSLRLYDVGTCVTAGPFPDRAHDDMAGHPRGPCLFDTPALVGLVDSAPYLHDGSAATLRDVLTTRNVGDRHGHTSQLAAPELDALVDYLRSR